VLNGTKHGVVTPSEACRLGLWRQVHTSPQRCTKRHYYKMTVTMPSRYPMLSHKQRLFSSVHWCASALTGKVVFDHRNQSQLQSKQP